MVIYMILCHVLPVVIVQRAEYIADLCLDDTYVSVH